MAETTVHETVEDLYTDFQYKRTAEHHRIAWIAELFTCSILPRRVGGGRVEKAVGGPERNVSVDG